MKVMPRAVKILVVLMAGLLSAATLAVCVVAGVYLYFGPQLPNAGEIGDPELNEPLRIYTSDGKLIRQFGIERRLPRTFEQIPTLMIEAFLAAEDDRFYQHFGVDYQGIMRAVWNLITTGRKTEGGSTITMQLARNLYLSNDRTYVRKIKEIILALRLESQLTKEQILEIYLNKIYLGSGAYGVGAAAEIYYHKPLDGLNLAQVGMIAGLPKAPSRYSPMVNPELAIGRRSYVLGRMLETGAIDSQAFERAMAAPVTASAPVADERFEADYVAELVRQDMIALYGEEAYTRGFEVITTLDSERQRAANRALRRALLAYDARHAWRGAQASLDDDTLSDTAQIKNALAERPSAGGLVPAAVIEVAPEQVRLQTERYDTVTLAADNMPWLESGEAPSALVSRGDVVRLAYTGNDDDPWTLAQIPEVQGALVALDPDTGGVEAMVGGFAFNLSNFNRAVQARRQPGSAFKPFLYSAALANGFTPASIINDAPVVYDGPQPEDMWRPQNYSGRIHGPTRLRGGLVHSRNLVSIRLLRAIGIGRAIDHISQFGLPEEQMPRNLSLSLGSASFSPLQMAHAYAVMANGGFGVEPYYIEEIIGDDGEVVFNATPPVACEQVAGCEILQNVDVPASEADSRLAPRVIEAANIYIVADIMRDVIQHGTGRGALKLGRSDLSGKTGTTNEQVDAWFVGFNSELAAVTWVGFDSPQPLGSGETGARAALPMWVSFMGSALAGVPESIMPRPPELESVRIDPQTGQRAIDGGGIVELFRPENVPTVEEARSSQGYTPSEDVEQLF